MNFHTDDIINNMIWHMISYHIISYHIISYHTINTKKYKSLDDTSVHIWLPRLQVGRIDDAILENKIKESHEPRGGTFNVFTN